MRRQSQARRPRSYPVAHTALRPAWALCQLRSLRSSAHIWPSGALRAHRCSAHTGPALHTECPAPRSQDAALSVLNNKRFATLDNRFESIDGRFTSIDDRLDKLLKELESVAKYLKSVDKYLKSCVTHRWVKSLTVSSSVSFLLLTGLSRILTPARVFQADLLSLVGVVFASCFGIHFGMTFKSYGDEKPTEDLQ